MPSKHEPSALLAAVQRSPDAVAVHDRAAWVALYTVDGQVNDPVGSRPHAGAAAIERFYETFIAPNTIVFDVDRDIVCGMSVMRDLTVETTMSTGVVLKVPMHLRYDLADERGELLIRRLYAHWELPSMIVALAKAGGPGMRASAKLAPQLLSNQGIGGALGFMRGFRRVGGRGKRAAAGFLKGVRTGDDAAVMGQLASGTVVELPGAPSQSIADFVAATSNISWSKTLSAGRTVTVTLERNGRQGVAIFDFGAHGSRIHRVQMFLDQI